jgi:hypothetical protein
VLTGSERDEDVEVVDDVAGLVERLGLTDVVDELAARLLLDEVDDRVETVVCEAPTHHFAVLVAALEQRQNMAHLVVKRSHRGNSVLIREQIVPTDKLGCLPTLVTASPHNL